MSTDTKPAQQGAVIEGQCRCGAPIQRTIPVTLAAASHEIRVRCGACRRVDAYRTGSDQPQGADPEWVVATPDCRFGEVADDA